MEFVISNVLSVMGNCKTAQIIAIRRVCEVNCPMESVILNARLQSALLMLRIVGIVQKDAVSLESVILSVL